MKLWVLYLCSLLLISAITLILFALDKRRAAIEGKRRIPEIVLLSGIGFGGALGGLIGMYGLRHKSHFATKFHFALTVWIAAMLQFTGIILFLIREGGLLP